MANEKTKFDPLQYKQTTLQQWESAAKSWQEIEEKLSEFESEEGFVGSCQLVIAVGTK